MDGEYTAGGSLTLASLLDKAGEAIFQDFQSEYGLNLVELLRDDMPPYEILMLIRGLKLGSRFIAYLQGDAEFVDWNIVTYQLASILDAVNNVGYSIVASNSKRKPKAPKPSYRPKKGGRKTNNAFRQQLDMVKQRKAKGG